MSDAAAAFCFVLRPVYAHLESARQDQCARPTKERYCFAAGNNPEVLRHNRPLLCSDISPVQNQIGNLYPPVNGFCARQRDAECVLQNIHGIRLVKAENLIQNAVRPWRLIICSLGLDSSPSLIHRLDARLCYLLHAPITCAVNAFNPSFFPELRSFVFKTEF
jgi:hypothetical protein